MSSRKFSPVPPPWESQRPGRLGHCVSSQSSCQGSGGDAGEDSPMPVCPWQKHPGNPSDGCSPTWRAGCQGLRTLPRRLCCKGRPRSACEKTRPNQSKIILMSLLLSPLLVLLICVSVLYFRPDIYVLNNPGRGEQRKAKVVFSSVGVAKGAQTCQ